MIYVNAIVSIATILGLFAAALAWRHSLREHEANAEWYFAAAKVCFAAGIGFRLLLWDAIWGVGRRIHPVTETVLTALGGISVNIVSNSIILVGVYFSLRSRWLLIPFHERAYWPWWRSWQHPSFLGFGRRKDR